MCPHRAQRPHLISSHILQASLIRRAVAYSFCMNSVSCGKHSCTCLAMHHALLGHTYTRMLGHASCTCLVMPLVGHASCTAWSVMHHALLGHALCTAWSCLWLAMHHAPLLGHTYTRMHRVGQNHVRYFCQANHQICSHTQCIDTVLANPTYAPQTHVHIYFVLLRADAHARN